jgi:alkylation response protein AidB-like acyl-CoA dehydrogenase
MIVYKPPLEDLRFVLYELLDYEEAIGTLPGCDEAGKELADSILAEAARFCENELLPLNQRGDLEGCVFEKGSVRTPRGFTDAYNKFIAAGWPGLACARGDGGQGLPMLFQLILDEFTSSTNLSFGIYPGLTNMAYQLLQRHGSAEQKRLILPKLASGVWAGTMCLTETQCGSDLGLIRTRAHPQAAGTYKISGTKIFISGGEQDLTENIIHMVLARLPEAPLGTSGLSLFIVPKLLIAQDGTVGSRNAVHCTSIEENGHPGVRHLRAELRRRRRLSSGRAEQRHANHVHNDERRPARRGHPGFGARRDGISVGIGLCQRKASRALDLRPKAPR